MENPAEGENKHNPTGGPNPHPDPAAVYPEFTHDHIQQPTEIHQTGVPVNPTLQSHTNPVIIILQWLTYAFWGWTVLVLSSLVAVAFQRLIAGQGDPSIRSYILAALIVLLPTAFICDSIYSKKEPNRKTGAASLVMVIHAVIFALFAVGSLLFAAWSVVTLGLAKTDQSTQTANLISALVVFALYAATFIRTLNPSHISWVPKVYRYAMLAAVIVIGALSALPAAHSNTTSDSASSGSSLNYTNNTSGKSSKGSSQFDSKGRLQPSVVGGTQCDIPILPDGSTTGQVAITGGSTCVEAEANIQSANGKAGGNYTSNGYICTSTRQGAGTQWSSYWNNDFYSYNCTSGSKQVAFNLQTTAQKR